MPAAHDTSVRGGTAGHSKRGCTANRGLVWTAERPLEMPHSLHRDVLRDDDAPGAARRELEEFRAELEPLVYEDVALLLTELVTNSVRHAGPDAGDRVLLDLLVTPAHVRVDVRDGGPGFVPVAREPDDVSPYHWGLHILDRLADRWAVVPANGNGQTCVWFELDLPA